MFRVGVVPVKSPLFMAKCPREAFLVSCANLLGKPRVQPLSFITRPRGCSGDSKNFTCPRLLTLLRNGRRQQTQNLYESPCPALQPRRGPEPRVSLRWRITGNLKAPPGSCSAVSSPLCTSPPVVDGWCVCTNKRWGSVTSRKCTAGHSCTCKDFSARLL